MKPTNRKMILLCFCEATPAGILHRDFVSLAVNSSTSIRQSGAVLPHQPDTLGHFAQTFEAQTLEQERI
jgi:hypothetical protein